MAELETGRRQAKRPAQPLFVLTDRLFRARSADDVHAAALDAITQLEGCNRAAILLADTFGMMRVVADNGLSEDARDAFAGPSPFGEVNAQPISVSDAAGWDCVGWLKPAANAANLVGVAIVPLSADGAVIGALVAGYSERASFSDEDREFALAVADQVGFAIDRYRADAVRAAAEQAVRESESRYRMMAQDAPIMLWVSDRQGRCLHLNERLRSFWGITGDDAFDWSESLHPDDRAQVSAATMEAIERRQSMHVTGRYRRHDGRYRVLETVARPIFAADGTFEGMIGSNVDVTEREQADEHKRRLINELNHRVKNTLAVVQAVARRTFRSDAPRDIQLSSFERRLAALAEAHNLLSLESWKSAFLEDVARRSLNAEADARVKISGPPVELEPKQAVSAAMALHELYSNAVKHGALRDPDGIVTLQWETQRGTEPSLSIRWSETGSEPIMPPSRSGFGSTMIQQALAAELDAEVELSYPPTGLVCTITAPLPRNPVAA